MNKFPKDLFSIFKNAFLMYRKHTLKTMLLTVGYMLLSIGAIAWVLFLLFNYPLSNFFTENGFVQILHSVMGAIKARSQSSIILPAVHVVGSLLVALSFSMSIMYYRYLYLNTQDDEKRLGSVFMPFSVFISALITDVFLLLVSIVGLIFLIFPSFILTMRYKFVRLAIISSEKMGFSKLVEVPNAFASSAKIVDSKNIMSTFFYLFAIFFIKISAFIILAILILTVDMFTNGWVSVAIWSAIIVCHISNVAVGTYMYILIYEHLTSSSRYGQNVEPAQDNAAQQGREAVGGDRATNNDNDDVVDDKKDSSQNDSDNDSKSDI